MIIFVAWFALGCRGRHPKHTDHMPHLLVFSGLLPSVLGRETGWGLGCRWAVRVSVSAADQNFERSPLVHRR